MTTYGLTTATIELAKSVGENLKLLNQAIQGNAVPGPLVYDLAGHLGAAMSGLGAVIKTMSDGLTLSLTEFDVYDDNRPPHVSVEMANADLAAAKAVTETIGECLARVQGHVNAQYHADRRTGPTGPDPKLTRAQFAAGITRISELRAQGLSVDDAIEQATAYALGIEPENQRFGTEDQA